MLALEVAVVGGEDHDRVAELAPFLQRLRDRPDLVVARLDRAQAAPVVGGQILDLGVGQLREALDVAGLVGDVLLVEGGRLRQLDVIEGLLVSLRA